MCEAQNAVNPNGFTSILTKSQHKILVSKSDSSLNTLAKEAKQHIFFNRNADFSLFFVWADESRTHYGFARRLLLP